jgi:hypothetical protein
MAEHPRGTLACLLPEVKAVAVAEQQHRAAEAVCAFDRKGGEFSGRHVETPGCAVGSRTSRVARKSSYAFSYAPSHNSSPDEGKRPETIIDAKA